MFETASKQLNIMLAFVISNGRFFAFDRDTQLADLARARPAQLILLTLILLTFILSPKSEFCSRRLTNLMNEHNVVKSYFFVRVSFAKQNHLQKWVKFICNIVGCFTFLYCQNDIFNKCSVCVRQQNYRNM